MSTPVSRIPIVGGVAGGCGTSLVTALLGAHDVGQVAEGQSVDVLVCRSVSSHLTLATRLVSAAPRPPIVVVSADTPLRAPRVVRDRARMLEPQVPAVLWLGFVDPLRRMSDPIGGIREQVLQASREPEFRAAFAFRQQLVDSVITHMSHRGEDELATQDSAEAFRQTS